jgi:undecaprenyl phosphate N,N'-diacetylbacillosamine 1-phosphate transferase
MYRRYIKQLLDIVFAAICLVLLLPVILLVSALLAVANKGRVFFTQQRPGKNGQLFRLIKFKTMTDEKDENGKLLPDSKRLTKTGLFIRSTSLDELPQLINVLKGDMSFIGPRPLLPKYLPLYNQTQAKRHDVKPGITGWAQVNGRNALSWEQKFELDVWYVANVSFRLDLQIFWKTLTKIIKRDGINASNAATMPPFSGNQQ